MSAHLPADGSKAEWLQRLAPRLVGAVVPRFAYFTVGEWQARRADILATLAATFGADRVAVRSATRDEDRPGSGLAGHYRTELDVRADPASLALAIARVIASYPRQELAHHVLVQEMVRPLRRSGVVLTRDPATDAPYDVIELSAGRRSDDVTSGRASPIRVAVHHASGHGPAQRAGVAGVVAATRAVEGALDVARGGRLDIELAEYGDGRTAVLQVRPFRSAAPADAGRDRRVTDVLERLAARVDVLACPRTGLAGTSTVLGMMPDWNPAELIGAHPRPLAASLFRRLISDTTWWEARAALGYQALPGTPLVHMLAGRPYVDTRAAFNSFVPCGLPMAMRTALVDGWTARLRAHPELHDRVELEVAQTAIAFDTTARGEAALPLAGRAHWLDALRRVTHDAIDPRPRGSLAAALATLETPAVADSVAVDASLAAALAALRACRTQAARPFAVVARHAFMAEGLLRSLVARGALAPERLAAFRRSLATVAGDFAADWRRMADGRLARAEFLATYGHLRPGTFDVTSLPYARRDPALWEDAPPPAPETVRFTPSAAERAAIGRLLDEARLGRDVATFLGWAAAAIVGRERGKFLFARWLSMVLEGVAAWSDRCGFGRDDVAHLTIGDLRSVGATADRGRLAARIAAARARRRTERDVRLGPLIRDVDDLYAVEEPPVLPTFVTARAVVAPPVHLDGRTLERRAVHGRIVCIESADPGFDWLFGRGLGGLVTRFGGANSHMAIRCIELGVPAALGVGEGTFERVRRARLVELHCGERVVREAVCAR